MSALTIRNGEWIVVCDGKKALVLQNDGDAQLLNFKTVKVIEQKDMATHELGTDRPGRAQAVGSGPRSSVGQTDWHDQAEHTFLTHLAEFLDRSLAAGQTKSLVMVAPPRALGMLRPAYSNALRGAIRAEIDKDLVKMPVHEIERHLSARSERPE
ncbi:MAG TPA: host attachment family protein [Pseudolabrys sp.]|nr:host attachment family protein [Pseudolabrys sp.]